LGSAVEGNGLKDQCWFQPSLCWRVKLKKEVEEKGQLLKK
jgi:hypothetical protein